MTMIALEQVRQHLETLGLKQAVEVLDNTLDAAANQQLTYADMLAQTRMAHLPFHRTLDSSTLASSPPSTNGKSRNWPTWPS